MAEVTISPSPAPEPGALDGFQVRCTCGTVMTASLPTEAERLRRQHEAWHAKAARSATTT